MGRLRFPPSLQQPRPPAYAHRQAIDVLLSFVSLYYYIAHNTCLTAFRWQAVKQGNTLQVCSGWSHDIVVLVCNRCGLWCHLLLSQYQETDAIVHQPDLCMLAMRAFHARLWFWSCKTWKELPHQQSCDCNSSDPHVCTQVILAAVRDGWSAPRCSLHRQSGRLSLNVVSKPNFGVHSGHGGGAAYSLSLSVYKGFVSYDSGLTATERPDASGLRTAPAGNVRRTDSQRASAA